MMLTNCLGRAAAIAKPLTQSLNHHVRQRLSQRSKVHRCVHGLPIQCWWMAHFIQPSELFQQRLSFFNDNADMVALARQ